MVVVEGVLVQGKTGMEVYWQLHVPGDETESKC